MTAPTFDDDVRRLLDLQETSKLIDAELEEIRQRIRQHGSGQVGALKVSVTAQRRFSPVLAVEKLTPEQLAEIADTTLSGTKAKHVLPPALYEELLYEYGVPRVSVR